MSTSMLAVPARGRRVFGRKEGKSKEELAAEKKAADEKAAADKAAADKKAAEGGGGEQELTLEQITTIVQGAVLKTIQGELPTHLKALVTEEGVRKIVSEEVGKMKTSDGSQKKMNSEVIGDLISSTVKAQMDLMRKDKKFVQNPGDSKEGANPGGQSGLDVEFGGFSLRKGNLPLHMKQLLNRVLGKHADEGIDKADLETGKKHEDNFWNGIKTVGTKALTSTGTGTGAEWVPRTMSSELYRRMYLESNLIQSYMANEVDMPSDPYDYPLRTTRPVFKQNNTQNNRPPASADPGTANFTLTTKKLMAILQFSYEAEEDSIIPILPQLQTDLADAAAAALENAIINGDTTSSHQDSDITDADDAAKAWKGFRKLFLAASLKSDFSTGGLSRSNLLSLPKLMLKWGAKTNDLLWIVGTKGWNSLMNLDEVALAYARGATGTYVAGGPPPAPWGGKLIVSEQMRENLNASGVYDNTTTTKGTIICVNARQFVFGSRRQFTIELAKNPYSQTNDIIASFRKAFVPVEVPSSTIAVGAVGYNFTS